MKNISSLHIIGSRYSGGAERFFARLVGALQERGLPTKTLTRPRSAVSAEIPAGVEQFHVAMTNVRDPISRFRITRRILRENPDVVQTYMGRATRLTHIPASSKTVHISRLGGFYKLDGYRHAHAWVGNTGALCDYLVENGFPRRRVFHIPNFIEIPEKPPEKTLHRIRRELGIKEDAVLILGAGRLVKKKGFSILIESFDRLPEILEGKTPFLVIIGDGPEWTSLKEQVNRLKSGDRIRLAGWQADPDPYYAIADVFVCPSLHEPLGNVILEAWSNGTPVISTETDGARELIRDGVTGKLVPCGDITALSEAMRQIILLDTRTREEFVQSGLSVLERDFGKEAVVDSYIDLYEKLLTERPSSGGSGFIR